MCFRFDVETDLWCVHERDESVRQCLRTDRTSSQNEISSLCRCEVATIIWPLLFFRRLLKCDKSSLFGGVADASNRARARAHIRTRTWESKERHERRSELVCNFNRFLCIGRASKFKMSHMEWKHSRLSPLALDWTDFGSAFDAQSNIDRSQICILRSNDELSSLSQSDSIEKNCNETPASCGRRVCVHRSSPASPDVMFK